MAIKKADSGWLVDLQPGGRGGKRFRKTVKTKGEALAYEAWLKNKVREVPEWAPAQKDKRKLSDLVKTWYDQHGVNLRGGKDAQARLLALCTALGEPTIASFQAEDFSSYRARRLKDGIKPETLNREHAYLRSVFNELKRMGVWKGENPLSSLRKFKVTERELSFLNEEQIRTLLVALEGRRNRDSLLVTKVCLATGARWSEAEGLRPSQVRDGAIHLSNTKSGRNRSIPISKTLEDELKIHLVERHGSMAGMADRFFTSCMAAFRQAVKAAGIALPEGQSTHVLRHTFASFFMMGGGNILALQRILGHASLTMTMRYAHLAPEHLEEAKRLNPLARLTIG